MTSRNRKIYWLHTKHLGNSSRMTDQNGTMVYRGEFDPYGNLVYEWGLAGLNTKKFTGYERDSNTGLDYTNARMYGPGRGRFMQPDPSGLKGAKVSMPETLNRYAYVHNDPVNLVDRNGAEGERPYDPFQALWDLWAHSRDLYAPLIQPEPDVSSPGIEPLLPTYKDILLGYMYKLLANKDCLAAIGEKKINDWISLVSNNQVKFYHKTSQAKIPNWDGQTVANYWDNMDFDKRWWANGVTVTTGGKFDDMGNPNPNGNFTDAQKFNTIIINTLNDNNQLERTLLHEFMHWEVSGNHVAIADNAHLKLSRFGYENLDNDDAASSAINEFLKNGCK